MASIKISELEQVVNITEEDVLPIVNEGVTKKSSIKQLQDLLSGSSYVPFKNLGETRTVSLDAYGTYFVDYPSDVTTVTVYCKAEGTSYTRTIKGGGVLIYMPTNTSAYKSNGTLIHISWLQNIYYFNGYTNHYNSAILLNVGQLEITNEEQTITAKKTFNVLPETSVAPTSDNQLVNKSYVDTSISTAITQSITTVLEGEY